MYFTMIALRTTDFKTNIEKYLKQAFSGDKIIIIRPHKENVAVISESRLNELEKIEQNSIYEAKLKKGFEDVKAGRTKERGLIEE